MTNMPSTKIDLTSFAIVFAFACVIAGLVYFHGWEFRTTAERLTWQQPEQVSNDKLIHPDNYRIQFDSAEKAIRDVQFDKNGQLVLNSHTANILEASFSIVPIDATEEEIQRFKMLTNRVHPYIKSEQLANLILKYRDYTAEKFEFDKQQSRQKSLAEAEQALKHEIKLKEKFFGKQVSRALFGNKHTLANYIIQRRKILADNSLDNKQKEKKLIEIKKTLEQLES